MGHKGPGRLVPAELPPLVREFLGVVWQRPRPDELLRLSPVSSEVLAGFPTFVHQLLSFALDETPDLRVLPPLLHQLEDFIIARQITNHMSGSVIAGAE